jgi:hypothetical protein
LCTASDEHATTGSNAVVNDDGRQRRNDVREGQMSSRVLCSCHWVHPEGVRMPFVSSMRVWMAKRHAIITSQLMNLVANSTVYSQHKYKTGKNVDNTSMELSIRCFL